MTRRRHPLRFEHRHQPLLPRHAFYARLVGNFAIACSVIGVALGLGVLGYHVWVGLDWLDALMNASMILGGMGAIDPITSTSGKWFASFYALFSGVVFLGSVGLLFAPIVHRFLHRFHLDQEDEERRRPPGP